MQKHIIIYSKKNAMKGVLKKYVDWSSTGDLEYRFYAPTGSESHEWLLHNNMDVSPFRIVNRIFRYVYLFRPIFLNGFREIHSIRYVGADFSLLVLLIFCRNLFLELHSNHLVELRLRPGFEGKAAYILEYFLQKLCFKLAKGVVAPSLAIARFAHPHAPTFVLLNSCISKQVIRFSSEKKKKEILIMASSFSEWHGLDEFQNFGSRLYLELGIKLRVIGAAQNIPDKEYIINSGFIEDDAKLCSLISTSLYALDSLGYNKLKLDRSSSIKMFKYLEFGTPVLSLVGPPIEDDNLLNAYNTFRNYQDMLLFLSKNMVYNFELSSGKFTKNTILKDEINFYKKTLNYYV